MKKDILEHTRITKALDVLSVYHDFPQLSGDQMNLIKKYGYSSLNSVPLEELTPEQVYRASKNVYERQCLGLMNRYTEKEKEMLQQIHMHSKHLPLKEPAKNSLVARLSELGIHNSRSATDYYEIMIKRQSLSQQLSLDFT